MLYATIPVFGGKHKRLYIETQLKYIASDHDNSTNHPIYVVEQDLGLTILHTSANEAESLLFKKPLDSKMKAKKSDQKNRIWKLFSDGASSREGSGVGVVLISSIDQVTSLSYKLEL